MDILIKSFNRPYYLDRCLFSIEKHVKNFSGKIVVLDDGTPEIFLNKILSNYPNVEIKKSEFYTEKQQCTLQGIRPKNYVIPIDLWVKAAEEASDNFLLIEDDTWFIDDIDFKETDEEMKANQVALTKLYWIGNEKINASKESVVKKNIVLIKPKLYTIVPALYYFIFYKFNRFKIRQILQRLKINTIEKKLAYYSIYAVAGVLFNRAYYTQLWKNHESKIDEGLQIYNAVKVLNKQKDSIAFAHYKHEILKTGFMSAATNQNKEAFKGNVDMFVFNKLLNEAWLSNRFDVLHSLPKDIAQHDIIAVIESDPQKRISAEHWLSWVNDFKNQYLSIGCIID